MDRAEKLMLAAIAAILVVMLVGWYANAETFERVCAESGGTTVWDGRQYQCIAPKGAAK
jgi:hypothetical protein